MSNLTGAVQIFASDIYKIGTDKLHALGTMGLTGDGRVYRYVRAGATALDPGKLTVAATQAANHENIAVAAAAAVGDTSVTVTLGATAATANQYADGYLVINDAAGEGIAYPITGHPAADSAASLTVQIAKPGIQVALTTSSEASLVLSPWADIVISATDQADMPVGVPNVTITAAYYGWVQTRGPVALLADETLGAGDDITTGTGVAGAVEVVDAVAEPRVGYALQAGVDTEYRACYLQID